MSEKLVRREQIKKGEVVLYIKEVTEIKEDVKEKKILGYAKKDFFDLLLKIIGLSGIIIGWLTYMNSLEAERVQKEKEFRKEISIRQLSYYSEISEAIGQLLTIMEDSLLSSQGYKQKKNRFLELYYGKMNLIESKEVDQHIHSFFTLLEKYETDEFGVKIHDLRGSAFALNDAFRKSIRGSFDVRLDSLTK